MDAYSLYRNKLMNCLNLLSIMEQIRH